LNCSGGTSTPVGQFIPQANFTIFLNTQVTSRLLNSSNQSEALMTVDEPTFQQTSPAQTCTSITGCAAIGAGPNPALPGFQVNSFEFKQPFNSVTGQPCSPGNSVPLQAVAGQIKPDGCYVNPNVFQGTVSGNSVTFVGIPIDPPGTQTSRIYRITNVRANATIPAPGGSGTPGQIIALISATPATSPGGLTSTFSINNPTQIVGFVQTSLSTSITGVGSTTALSSTGIALQQCTGAGVTGGKNSAFGQLNFNELFPTAFKTRTVAGSGLTTQDTLGIVYNSESGYV